MRRLISAVIVVSAVTAAFAQQRLVLDDAFWEGPWAFERAGTRPKPLPSLRYSNKQTVGNVAIRLDDGTLGSIRIGPQPCATAADCPPKDCGCLGFDSFRIEVLDSAERIVGRAHLWAAYGMFHVIPIDLVDGPADELLVVRVPAHSAPPAGFDLKILKLTSSGVNELMVPPRDLARTLISQPMACARWRKRLFIDPKEPKPKSIELRRDVAASPGCQIEDAQEDRMPGPDRELLRFVGDRYEVSR